MYVPFTCMGERAAATRPRSLLLHTVPLAGAAAGATI
jgi:hypothetical protein